MVGKKDREHSIYRITCLISGKSYIGLTCQNVKYRWSAHISDARDSAKIRCRALVRALRKYPRKSFVFEVLTTACDRTEAAAIERGLIAQYGTLAPSGYNLTCGGELTKEPAIEVRARMSASAKRRGSTYVRTEEIRQKMSASRKSIMSDELRQIASKTHKGKVMSAETRAKISASKKGKKPKFYPKNRKSRAPAKTAPLLELIAL